MYECSLTIACGHAFGAIVVVSHAWVEVHPIHCGVTPDANFVPGSVHRVVQMAEAWRCSGLPPALPNPSVVSGRQMVVISGLVDDASDDAFACSRAQGFVLLRVCKPARLQHVDVGRLAALVVKHGVQWASVLRVERTDCAVSRDARVARRPKDITGLFQGGCNLIAQLLLDTDGGSGGSVAE